MVKIRLLRTGARNQPSYRVVAADSHSKRDGKIIEILGHYNARSQPVVFEIKKEPRLEITDIIGAVSIYIGLLTFLVCLHVMAIEETGDTAAVLSTAFTVFLTIYVTAVVLGVVGLIVHLLRWLTYQVTTPKWMKEKNKGLK